MVTAMTASKNGRNRDLLTSALVITILLLVPSVSDMMSNAGHVIEGGSGRDTSIFSSYTITRRQAVLDYIQALYVPQEGRFYGWLQDTPTDPRIGSYPDIYNVYDPYTILKQLGCTGVIDWSNCTNYLISLVNTDPSSAYYNLVNLSRSEGAPCTTSCAAAVQLFPDLGLGSYMHDEEIASFIAKCQTSSGGFRDDPYNEISPEMTTTWSALETLSIIGKISSIDTSAALSYVLSCYHADGGFSNTPDSDSSPDIVPLGLFCLNILGRPGLIRVQNTTDYLLQYFDSAGTMPDGTLVNTERFVWSLDTLGTLDQIDADKMLSWVISCQTHDNGGFFPFPGSTVASERLEWIRAAVHILFLCNRTDLLDENFTVTEYPQYQVPQWYLNYINEHFGTTTDTGEGHPQFWPRINIVSFLLTAAPYVGVLFLVSLPGAYIVWSNRRKKLERREQRDRRKHMKAG
jgi:prenyltransferase beta subunit